MQNCLMMLVTNSRDINVDDIQDSSPKLFYPKLISEETPPTEEAPPVEEAPPAEDAPAEEAEAPAAEEDDRDPNGTWRILKNPGEAKTSEGVNASITIEVGRGEVLHKLGSRNSPSNSHCGPQIPVI